MFFLKGNILEEVNEYNYLGIDFNNKLNWEDCRKKIILGGWKALSALQNRCREAKLWDWNTIKVFFGLLAVPVILYGCEFCGLATSLFQNGNKLRKSKNA